MSAETAPIDPVAFAQALESLPLDALHSKAAELRNSISHLKSSNEQMLPFAEEGDQDCKEAMFENLVVIGRINERISLLRVEVERRGMRWADAEVEDAESKEKHMTDADGQLVNGNGNSNGSHGVNTTALSTFQETAAGSGRLTDAELMAQMQERMEMDDEDGVHL